MRQIKNRLSKISQQTSALVDIVSTVLTLSEALMFTCLVYRREKNPSRGESDKNLSLLKHHSLDMGGRDKISNFLLCPLFSPGLFQ